MNIGTRDNPTYVPPEVCIVLPGQDAKVKLSGDQTAAMIKFTARKPAENARSIVKDGIATVGLTQQNTLMVRRPHLSTYLPT